MKVSVNDWDENYELFDKCIFYNILRLILLVSS